MRSRVPETDCFDPAFVPFSRPRKTDKMVAWNELDVKKAVCAGYDYSWRSYKATHKDKQTVLFIHGFPESARSWRYQVDALTEAGYGVLVPDCLGYGDTAKPDDVAAYSYKSMCEQLVALLDHEGVDKVVVVGHDHGSGPAGRLALFHPDRVLAVCVVSLGISTIAAPFDPIQHDTMMKELCGFVTNGYVR